MQAPTPTTASRAIPEPPVVFEFEDFEIDAVRFELRRAGAPIPIPRLVFDLILYLATHRDRPVTKAEIFEHVWTGRTVTEASLTQAMTAARRALSDTPEAQRVIRTVHGRGYWWVADTRVTTSNPDDRSDPFVGRSAEINVAIRALKSTRSGPASLLRVIGEAGIGKTRFAAEVTRYAREAGYLVLTGRCAETDGEAASSPWHHVIRGALELIRDAEGNESARSAVPNAVSSRVDLIEDVSKALNRCVGMGPTLVVLDDLHRADRLSKKLLVLALRDLASARLLVMATQRQPTSQNYAAEESQLARVARSETIALGPLRMAEVRELASRAGVDPGRIDVAAVLHRSGGNPFFATELLRTANAGDGAVPLSIVEAIRAQIGSLSPACRAILSHASVCGREFDVGLMSEASDLSADVIIRLLQEAVSVGLLEEVPKSAAAFRFRHVLVRDAVYSSMELAEKRRYHASLALAIKRGSRDLDGPHLSTIAHHLREALPLVDRGDVVAASLRAARFATSSLEPDAAILCCRQALGLLGATGTDLEDRIQLMIALAVAQLRAGYRGEGRATLRAARDEARAAGAPDLAARAALSLAPGFFSIETGVVDWELIGMLEDAIATVPGGSNPVRVQLLGRMAQALYWSEDGARVQALADEAKSVADRVGTPAVSAYATLASYGARWSPKTFRERLAAATSIDEAVAQLEDHELQMMGSVFRLTTFLEAGLLDRVRSELVRLRQMALRAECALGRWYPPMYDAMLAIGEGRFGDAKALMASYHAIGERLDDVNVTQTYLLQSVEMLWQAGEAASVLDAVAQNIDRHPTLHEWQAALVFLQARAGQLRDARNGLAQLAGRPLPGLNDRMNATIGVAALCETALMLGDTDAARKLASVIEPWESQVIVAGYGVLCWGSVERVRAHLAGVLSEFDAAEHWYRRALLIEKRSGNLLWRARTQLAYANLLLRLPTNRARARCHELIASVKGFAARNCLGSLEAEANALVR